MHFKGDNRGLTIYIYFLWLGSLLQCTQCDSVVSYDDCEANTMLQNCTNSNSSCSQVEIQLVKGNDSLTLFEKRCLPTSQCEEYMRGEVGECITRRSDNYTGVCRGICCTGENCNIGNLLLPTTTMTTTMTTTESKGSMFIISVLVLLLGVFLTVVNIN